MVLSCKIHVEKPQGGMYRSAQIVKGMISYEIDNPATYKTAVVSLIGKAKCNWVDGIRKQTCSGKDVFLSLHLSILNELPEEKILPAGEHEFRFQFDLPYKIPSSYEDQYSTITYVLQVKFKKASYFSLTQKYKEPITVYGYVVPPKVERLTYELQKKFYSWFVSNGQVIDFKVQINKTFLSPGENVTLDLFVNNDSNIDVRGILIELHGKTTYTGEAIFTFITTTGHLNWKIPDSTRDTPPILSHQSKNFTRVVPIPSDIYSIQNCKTIDVSYYIQVTMVLKGLYKGKSINIPIVIGHSCDGDSSIMEQAEGLVLKPSYYIEFDDGVMEMIAGHGSMGLMFMTR